jgi:hypothetical protein
VPALQTLAKRFQIEHYVLLFETKKSKSIHHRQLTVPLCLGVRGPDIAPTNLGTRPGRRCWTAEYVTDDPGLAVHPRRVLHGPAAPDWRGEIRVGRTRTLTQRSNLSCGRSFLRYHLFWATQ